MLIRHIMEVENRKIEAISTRRMVPGDIGEIISSQAHSLLLPGSFLLRTYSGFVLLNEPIRTWDPGSDLGMVQLLPPGSVLKIKIGDRS